MDDDLFTIDLLLILYLGLGYSIDYKSIKSCTASSLTRLIEPPMPAFEDLIPVKIEVS